VNLDLEPARAVLGADGVDLVLLGTEGGVATVELLVVDAECADCVLPRELLEPVVLDLLRPATPDLVEVRIVDPREAG
jgi:hypothetical protein